MHVCEVTREAGLAARWGASAFAGRWLRAVTGERLAVVYPGRPGGPAGPDFRDAVLLCPDGSRVYGDVEIHLRARGWHEHGHAADRRYNRVVLHVVRRAEGARRTPLASGAWAPIIELEVDASAPDLTPSPFPTGEGSGGWRDRCAPGGARWPCAGLGQRMPAAELRGLLRAAGEARLAERAEAFAALLREAAPDGASLAGWTPADRVLFIALAEGLAYGRERETLREAGRWLAAGNAPAALLREAGRVPALDAARLEGLLTLHARWEASGPWQPLRAALERGMDREGARALLAALRVPGGLVSAGRAAILAANVALPFALALAGLEGDERLAGRARALYLALPGLPSNQITRVMQRQLGLSRAPAGACAQQGLHHVWAHWCREKQCAAGCVCGRVGVGVAE